MTTIYVSSGTTTVSTTVPPTTNYQVQDSGLLAIVSGGAVTGTVITIVGLFPGEEISAGGTDFAAAIYGGDQYVSSGGTATSATIFGQGARQDVVGSTLFTTLNSGYQYVELGGTAIGTTINSSGTQLVSSGSLASETTAISGGTEYIYSGGGASTTILNGGQQFVFEGATASITTVNAGGFQYVPGGIASSTTINAGGTQSVALGDGSNGSAVLTTISSGGLQFIAFGGSAIGATISFGGHQTVSGGTADGTMITGGGAQEINQGGVASNTTVVDGGHQQIDLGGTAFGDVINSGGAEYVYGTTTDATVSTGGIEFIYGAGTAVSATLLSGGVQNVQPGGVGSATIISGGTMELTVGGSASGAITFAGTGGTLQIDGTTMPGNTISGFVPGDMFYLAGVAFDPSGSADLLSGNVLQITEGGRHYDLQLDPSQDFAGKFFHLNAATGGGTLVTEDTTPCYCAGTLIRTDRGEVEVERLAVGDNVITADGAVRPIRWIGRRSYAGRFARGSHVLPICIKAGALDVDQPRRDLWVSPQHAMFLEGVLIEAIDLINGVSIIQADRVERVDYFHIELDTHDVIIAEGALAESFVDDDSRGIFQNAHEFAALYPNTPAIGPARYCAPRVAFGADLEAARRQISQRAGIPYVPSSNAKRPRALVVDSWVPQLGHDGGANAILDHIGALQAAGFEVSFLALHGDCSDASALASLGLSPLSVPRSGRFSDFAHAHAGQFDLVYLHRVETATRCLRPARRYFDAQIIYSVADLHHLRLKAQSQFDTAHASELTHQAYQFALQELSAALSADCVITHSVTEAEQLEQLPSIAAAGKVRVVPWAVPLAPVQTPFADRFGLAFIGSFAFPPNVDAARWLVSEIMPLVWRQAPEVQCLIVGSDLSDELRCELARPRVDVRGRVDRLGEVFERIRCTVAPLRFGAGIKDKVLRSMAAGLPSVGTPEAFRGMHALPAAIISTCQGETASELAAAVLKMHRDEPANTNCREIGLAYIAAFYNQPRIDRLTRDIVQPAILRHRARMYPASDLPFLRKA